LAEYVKDLNKTHELKTPILTMKGTEEIPNHPNKAMMEVEVAMVYNSTYSENIISFVNNIKTHEGGTHETGFKSAITKVVSDYLEKNGNSKEKDIKIQGEDTREGLIAIVSVKVPEPQFEGQTKGKLGSAFVLPIVRRIVTAKLEQFFEENPIEAKNILEKSLGAARGREAAKKARDLTRKTTDKNSLATLPGKLADCQTKDSNLAELFLVEGDSAAGSGKMGRNRLYQAILALKGKILNVEKSEASKVLNSEEIKNIITAIGTNVGQDFNLEKLRYKKIIVMTDADVDGSHIQTLILTFFFRYLKPIIENGYLYIAQPPLYRFKKGNFETYLKDDKALNEFLIKEVLNTIEVGDKTSNKRFLLLAVEYKNIMIELEKKYPGVKVLKKIIEEDINEVDNEKIISIIKDLNYNIFSTSIFNDTYNYFIQTEAGAAELSLNNDVLNDSLIISGKNIFKKLNEIENHAFDVKTTIEDLEKVLNNAKKGTYIQRYKGLGEMNPEQLWETTMHPENRNLLQVEISDAEKAEQSFVLFMGSEVEPRKAFILDNAQNVKNLDV